MKNSTMKQTFLAIFMAMISSFAFSQAVNTPVDAQTDAFTVSFDITPSHAPMDAGVGFSEGAVAGWGDMSSIIGVHSSGFFQARNGGAYEKMELLRYEANMTYQIVMTVDVVNNTYSATVKPEGGFESTIAYNFGFRKAATSIDNLFSFNNEFEAWGGVPGATLDISNYNLADTVASSGYFAVEPSIYLNFPIPAQAGIVICEFDATPTLDTLECAVTLNNAPSMINPDWGTMSTIVRFGNNAHIDCRNGTGYEAPATPYKYTKDQNYHVKMEVNIITNTYDVYITNDTATIIIADNFAFRNATQELNYRAIASVSGDQSELFVTNFDIRNAFESTSILYAPTLPVIDGDLSDGFWDAIEENVNNTAVRAMDTVTVDNQQSATWKAVWTEDTIFVMVNVTDKTPYDASDKAWTNDGVHIYWGVQNQRNGNGGNATATSDPADVAKTFGQYYFKADGSQGYGGEIHPDNGLNYMIMSHDTGYVFEGAFPVKALNRHGSDFAPMGDGSILFDIDVIDHNGVSFNELQWSSYQNNWANMNNAGELSFVKTLDYTMLTSVIDSSKTVVGAAVVGLSPEEYRQESIDAANVAIADAEGVNGVLGTQTEIDAATADLRADMLLFTPNMYDYTALATVIDSSQAVVDAAVPGDAEGEYTQSTINAANLAVYNAEQVLAGADSQAEIDQAMADLRAAMALFVPNGPSAVIDVLGASFAMYPNPVMDVLQLKNIAAVKSISIYNSAGLELSVYSNHGESMQLNLSDLNAGLYIIKFTTDDNVCSKHFIKN